MDGNILIFLAVLPSIFLGKYIYKMDKFGKESRGLLTKLFFLGILATFTTLLISGVLSTFFPILDADNSNNPIALFIEVFIGVALVEEFSKWIYLKTTTWNNKEFDHIYDAIVYAVFVSLGFATFENILYVLEGGLVIAIIRAIASVPGHVFDAIFMGYHYGISKQAEIDGNKKKKNIHLILSILVPAILHGIFDYLLSLGNILVVLLFIIYVIILYIVAFKKVKKIASISENMIAYYCTNCGTKCKTNYCTNCGTKIVN